GRRANGAAGPCSVPRGPHREAERLSPAPDGNRPPATSALRGCEVMGAYVARRLGHAAVTLLVAVMLIFVSVRVLPGNPLLSQFGQHTDPQQMEQIRAHLGWDQPIWKQFVDYAGNVLLRGDFGESIVRPNESVASALARRVPATLELALAAMALALPLGIGSGVAAAVWRNRWPDYI